MRGDHDELDSPVVVKPGLVSLSPVDFAIAPSSVPPEAASNIRESEIAGVEHQDLDRAEVLFAAMHGEQHLVRAHLHNVRGDLSDALGDPERALAEFTRALEIAERLLPPDHPEHTMMLVNVGSASLSAGRVAEARALFNRALRTYEGTRGSDDPEVAVVLAFLGKLEHAHGDRRSARSLLARAVTIVDRKLPAVDLRRVFCHLERGVASIADGRPGDTLADADAMLAALVGAELEPYYRLRLVFVRAQALYGLGRRAAAQALVRDILAQASPQPDMVRLRHEVETWLAHKPG